jgi:WD40 repeat protein
VLLGHTGPVLDVAVMTDGERVVSASADGTLRVWDVNTGQTLHVLARHTGAVTSVASTTEGDCAISASTDGTLRVWNVATGRMRAVMIGHSAEVSALETIPGEPQVLSASADGMLRLWHIVGPLSNTFAGHSGAITGMAVPRDGWGERLVYLSPGSLLLVTGLVAVGSNRGVVSASADGTIRLWELISGRCQAVLAAGVPFRCAAVAPDGHAFVAGDEQGQVHFLQLRTD